MPGPLRSAMGVAYNLQKHGERTILRLEQAHQVEVDELEDKLKAEQELSDALRRKLLDVQKPGPGRTWTHQHSYDELVAASAQSQERKTKGEEEEKEKREVFRLARRKHQLVAYKDWREAERLERRPRRVEARKPMKAQKAMKAMKAQKVMKAMKAKAKA